MGKRIVDEDMVLNIIINGDNGKNELFELEQAVRDLNGENEKLEKSLQKYEKQIALNEKTIIRYSASLKKEEEKQARLQQLFEEASDKVATLNQRYKELDKTARNTPAGERLKKEMFAASEAQRRYAEQGRAAISAQKGLSDSIKKLTVENTKLNAKREEATATLNKNSSATEKGKQEIDKLRKNLDITTLSVDELNREIARMTVLFRQADPNTPAWEAYRKKLVELRGRHQELSAQAQQTKGVLCRMADGINKYWNLVITGLASLSGIFFSIKGAINKFVEFTDVVSDVQKTTGLTERGVLDLNESLKNIDTRTAQEELLGLARIGGKLGIEGKENLEGFVRAADKINVALKEDLGGDTEESIRQVGKLVDIFHVEEDFGIEQGMLKVGSVINELGASSTANEGYIVEFSKRVAGVAPSAGVSVDAVMGLAATLDQFGQLAEASSTVYSQIMSKMFKNTATYANIAGMSLVDFSDLMKSDANEAFIRVLEGLKGNNDGMETLVRNLGDMQLNGVRATTVIGTLASNTATLREQQKLANEAFREGTSLTNEFNIKNNNLAAMRDKAKEQLNERIRQLGQQLQPLQVLCTSSMSLMIKTLGTLITFFGKYGGVVLALVSIYGTYLIATKLNVLWTTKLKDSIGAVTIAKKIDLIWTKSLEAGTFLLAAAKALLTFKIKEATVAFKAFSKAVKMNPLGLLLSIIAAVGITVYGLCTRLNDTEKAMKRVSDANKEFEKSVASEQITIDRLFGKLKTATEGTKEWGAARKAITDKYGQYLKDMGIEIDSLQDVEKAYRAVSAAARQAAKDRAMEKAAAIAGDEYVNVEVEQLARIRETLLKDNGDYKGSALFENLKKEILSGKGLSLEMQKIVADSQKTKNWMGYLYEENDVKDAISKIREAKAAFEVEMKEINSVFGRTDDVVFSDPVSALSPKGSDIGRNKSGNDKPTLEGKDDVPVPDYNAKIIALKESYAAEKVTKEEYEKQLDDLELAHLQYRLKNFEGDEEERLELEQKIADKKISIREKRDKEDKAKEKDKSQEYIDDLLSGENELSRNEKAAYHERLKKAGLFGKDRKEMTENELKALEILQKQHADNLKKIEDDNGKKRGEAYVKEISDRLKNQETGNSMELAQLQIKHNNELSRENIRVSERKEIAKRQAKEMLELKEEQAKEMLDLLNELFVSAEADELNLEEQILTEEQKQNIEKRILELQKLLTEFGLEGIKIDTPEKSKLEFDVLGMSSSDWETFFENLKNGEAGIKDIEFAIGALSNAWSAYNNLKTAQEKKELKRYEKDNKKKKADLDKQLESGIISQEQYNARVSQLDADLDAKKEEVEKKQAERERRLALFNVITSTAIGIAKAWEYGPILGPILGALVTAMGVVQTATIMAAQYAKGKYPVIGADDGMTYQADYASDNLQTGIYQSPTLGLFSEKEPEMVVDGATTRRLVFDYPQIYQSIMDVAHGRTPQYDSGKYPPANSSVSTDPDVVYAADPEMKQLLRKNLEMMEELKEMDIVISMFGRNGLMKAINKVNKFKQNTTY